jgi:hypothetical protein
MRVGLAALLLAACAPKPAEKLEVLNARSAAREDVVTLREPQASAPRPEFAVDELVPDFHDLLRWPLSAMNHPTLEPKFGIAAVFADPGIGWEELCKRGVQNRSMGGQKRDELDYLRGWCSTLNRDVDNACAKLTPLVSSTVLGIPDAVRIDIANILVDNGHADKAEHWIKRHNIDDVELLDTLAASYAEVGNDRDAWTINRHVMDSDVRPTFETMCRRLAKHIVLSPEGERLAPAAQLEKIVTSAKIPNPVCAELHHALRCWMNPAYDCSDYLRDVGVDQKYGVVLRTYYTWPAGSARVSTWLSVANNAQYAADTPEGLELTLGALEAAAGADGGCQYSVYQDALKIEKVVYAMQKSTPERLRRVIDTCANTFSFK